MTEHPDCPVSPLFEKLFNGLWYFKLDETRFFCIRSARGSIRETIARCAHSIFVQSGKQVEAVGWLEWGRCVRIRAGD